MGVFELTVKTDFAAAHKIEGYDGDCARLHGHNWVVEANVVASGLDHLGMVLDFRVVKRALKEIIQPWDHQYLNELKDFENISPSAENVAMLTFNRLDQTIRAAAKEQKVKAHLKSIRIWENERCSITYLGHGTDE